MFVETMDVDDMKDQDPIPDKTSNADSGTLRKVGKFSCL